MRTSKRYPATHPFRIQVDLRSTREVEETRCLKNNKPFRTQDQKRTAYNMAHVVDGTYVSSAPSSLHDRCQCGALKPCMMFDAEARNSRVRRLRDQV